MHRILRDTVHYCHIILNNYPVPVVISSAAVFQFPSLLNNSLYKWQREGIKFSPMPCWKLLLVGLLQNLNSAWIDSDFQFLSPHFCFSKLSPHFIPTFLHLAKASLQNSNNSFLGWRYLVSIPKLSDWIHPEPCRETAAAPWKTIFPKCNG